MIECLLFDNDGTLVDSEYLSAQAIKIKFLEFDIVLDANELARRFKGWKLRSLLEQLASDSGLDFNAEFIASYRRIASEIFARELQPVTGVPAALDALPHAKAVVSNGPMAKITETLDLTGLRKYFSDNLISAYDLGVWKPDPQLYLQAAEQMGFSASQCVVIEDSLVGVEAGVKAGMQTYFYNPAGTTCNYPQVISFKSMADLPSLIN